MRRDVSLTVINHSLALAHAFLVCHVRPSRIAAVDPTPPVVLHPALVKGLHVWEGRFPPWVLPQHCH